jgi:hypothetical protein
MFGFGKKGGATATPPVDLNTPVENPKVVAAIRDFADASTPKTQDALTRALRAANFLVPMFTDEIKSSPIDEGSVSFEAGSKLKLLACTNEDDEVLLPLFTDWPAIREWTDEPASTLVMPAAEAFDLAASDEYAGAVVNPGGYSLPLGKDLLGFLLGNA